MKHNNIGKPTGLVPHLLFVLACLLSSVPIWAQSGGTWSPVDSDGVTPEKRHESAFVKLDGKFYLVGGRGSKKIQVYDPVTKTWSDKATSLNNIHHFQARAYDGKIYLLGALTGGYPDEDPLPNVLIYDPVQDKLLTGATIPVNRRRGSSGVALYQGKFYIVAGNRNGHSAYLDDGKTPANVAWVDKYDPATDTWSVLPDAPHARDHFFAEVIGNKLYVAGGRRSQVGAPAGVWSDTETAVDVLDLTTEQWLTGTAVPDPLPTARAGAATAVLNNELLVIGGEILDNPPSNLALPHTEVLNISTGQWRRAADLLLQRHATQAIVYGGDVYLAAGSKTRGGTEITPTEIFMEALSFDGVPDPTYPEWTNINNSPLAKSEANLVTYKDQYYIFHGFRFGIDLANTVEKYDPAANTWTKLQPMPTGAGVTHNGIALVGDKVWIVGGRLGDHPGPVTDAVYIYDIPTNSWSSGPTLPLPAGGGGLALLGRKLHYVGGFDAAASCDVNTHLVYDLDEPQAGWQDRTAQSPMPLARNHFATVTLGGKLYAVGGQHGHDGCGGGADQRYVHVYDPATDAWKRLADLPSKQSHAEPGTFSYNGKIVMVGGAGSGGMGVWEYDPATNAWQILTDMQLPDPLLAPGARVHDGRLYVMNGGYVGTANPVNITRVKDFKPAVNPGLVFNPGQLNVSLEGGQTETHEVILSNLYGEETTAFTLNSGEFPSWLSTNQSSGFTRESATELVIKVDAAGLSEGSYSFAVKAKASGYATASLTVNLAVSAGTPPPTTADFGVYLEGECGTVGGNWIVGDDTQASGGKYVVLAAGIERSINEPPSNVPANRVSFTVDLPKAGSYHLFARVKAADSSSDSYWVRINGGNWIKWWEGLTTGNSFAWREVLNSPYGLPAGTVTVEVAYREPGTQLDKLYLTNSSGQPSGTGGTAENCQAPPPPPPPPPATTDVRLYLEAECAAVGSGWATYSDAAASGGRYVDAVAGTGNFYNNPPQDVPAHRISFTVDLPEAGDYRLFSRFKAPDGSQDSYWVRINGGNWIKWWEALTKSGSFNWQEVKDSPYALPAGAVTIDFAYREPGTLLDKLFLTNTAEVPTGTGGTAVNCGTTPTPDNAFALRINAGGGTLMHDGEEFVTDVHFGGGRSYTNTAATVPSLYQTERSANPPAQFAYRIPVPDGEYRVRLHFAEIYWGAEGRGADGPGRRVFDVTLENSLVLDNYDINADVGSETVTVKDFTVTVTDGYVDLFLDATPEVGGVNQPKLSALEILGLEAGGSTTDPLAAFWGEAECAGGGSEWNQLGSSLASGGNYRVFPGSVKLNMPTTYGGSKQLSYNFSLDASGSYKVFLRLNAPSQGKNSFWVSVDNGPWLEYWKNANGDGPLTNGFEWREVLDGGAPVSFNLNAGNHTLRVAPREPGTELDKVYVGTSATPPSGYGESDLSCTAVAAKSSSRSVSPAPTTGLEMYPNPASTELRYRIVPATTGPVQIDILDLNGRPALSRTVDGEADLLISDRLDVSRLPGGTYLLRIVEVTGGEVTTRPFAVIR